MSAPAGCHPVTADAAVAQRAERPVIALVGRPNVGKSTFVARASRRFVETANAPGTTVSLQRVPVTVDGTDAWLVDLPGTRSLDDQPTGDAPFWELLLGAAPDAVLVVADAGNLSRHLPLAIACRDLGLPIVLAVNLTDEAAKRGITVDAGRLGQLINVPTHATCGRTGAGIDATLRERVAAGHPAASSGHGRAVSPGHRPGTHVPVPAPGPSRHDRRLAHDRASLSRRGRGPRASPGGRPRPAALPARRRLDPAGARARPGALGGRRLVDGAVREPARGRGAARGPDRPLEHLAVPRDPAVPSASASPPSSP